MRVSDNCIDCGTLIGPYCIRCGTCEDRLRKQQKYEDELRQEHLDRENALIQENKELKAKLKKLQQK